VDGEAAMRGGGKYGEYETTSSPQTLFTDPGKPGGVFLPTLPVWMPPHLLLFVVIDGDESCQ
jgi:hypothetical protein